MKPLASEVLRSFFPNSERLTFGAKGYSGQAEHPYILRWIICCLDCRWLSMWGFLKKGFCGSRKVLKHEEMMNKWQFRDVKLFTGKISCETVRISALGFSTFLHVSPWRLRFFNSPLQGIMNRVLPLQRGIQKSLGKLVQSVSYMMCFIWYTCVHIQFLAPSIFIS